MSRPKPTVLLEKVEKRNLQSRTSVSKSRHLGGLLRQETD